MAIIGALVMVILAPLVFVGMFAIATFVSISGGIAQAQACAASQSGDQFVAANNVSLSTSGLTINGHPILQSQAQVASKVAGIVDARPTDFPGALKHRAIIIGYEMGLTESSLQNLNYGDRDSLGVFQERPSQGWGTPRQIMHVSYSTNKILNAMLHVPGWQTLPYGVVAQRTERSAYPDRYATHQAEAEAIYNNLSFTSGPQIQMADFVATDCSQANEMQQKIGLAVSACLSKVGSDYTWSPPPDGASYVSWCYQQAGLKLPSTIDQLANYGGDTSTGLSTRWIPASDFKSGRETRQTGDILFYGDKQSSVSRSSVASTGLYIGSGATGNAMHVATYNARGSTHTPASGSQSGPERIKRAASLIMQQNFAVVGMQELQQNQRAQLLRSLGGRYGIYPSRPQYGLHQPGINSVNSIIWDKSQVSFVAGSSLPMPYYFNRRSMHIPLVTLQDAKSGQQFYVANTHDPAGAYAHLRYLDAERHAQDSDSVTASGLPMFFTGDFNSAYSEHARINQVWRHQRKYMTWCVMTRSGRMLDGYDASRIPVRTGECPQQTTREKGAGPVDHVYVSNNIHVSGYHYIADRKVTASDHGVVFIDASLPGAPIKHHAKASKLGEYAGVSKKQKIALLPVKEQAFAGVLRLSITATSSGGTSGPWQNPLHSGYTISDGYGWENSSVRGAHTFHDGVDLATSVGVPVYAAHGGVVTSAGYNSASGNQIIIDNDGPGASKFGTKYEHLDAIAPGIKPGSTIAPGQQIGNVGQTGNATGAHLHFSVCTDVIQCIRGSGAAGHATVDPIPFMLQQGVKL